MTRSSTVLKNLPRPHPGQIAVFKDSRRFNVLECGRRWGKTTFGLRLICASAMKNRRAAWFAPTQKLASEPWIDMKRILNPIIAKISERDRRIETRQGGIIDLWSLDNPDSGRGRKYHRIIIDEASIVRDLRQCWQESLRPTLTDYKGNAWFLGTPRGRNYFHQLFTKGQSDDPDWKSWRQTTIANPYIDAAEVDSARRELPEDVFGQEYLGLPTENNSNPFGVERIRKCIAPLSTLPPVAFGIDVAKSHDFCVLIGIDAAGSVCRFERWQSDWAASQARILGAVADVPTSIDSTGAGDPVLEALNLLRANITGYRFSNTSKQQLMTRLSIAISSNEVHYPDGVIVSELESFEYGYLPGGAVYYSAPHGLHDDTVCALALALYQKELNSRAPTLDVRLISCN